LLLAMDRYGLKWCGYGPYRLRYDTINPVLGEQFGYSMVKTLGQNWLPAIRSGSD